MRSGAGNLRVGAGLGALAAVAALALASAGDASGATPPFALRYVTELETLPNDEFPHEADPLCPPRFKVLGGGAFAVGGDPREDVEVTSTYPEDLVPEAGSQPDDGWTAAIVNSSDEAAGVGADAICAKGASPRYRSASIPIPEGGLSGRGVFCPRRTRVTGGGVLTSGAHKDIEVVSTFPVDNADAGAATDDGWFGRASNDSGTEQEMTVFVICAKLKRLSYLVKRQSLPGESVHTTTIQCRRGSRVLGGGVDLNENGLPSLDLEVESSFAVDGPDRGAVGDNGWVGVGHNDALTSSTIKVFAICRRPPG